MVSAVLKATSTTTRHAAEAAPAQDVLHSPLDLFHLPVMCEVFPPSESRIDMKLGAMRDAFRGAVYNKWLGGDDMATERASFARLEAVGDARCIAIAGDELKRWTDPADAKLLFRERVLYKSDLQKITLPLDPTSIDSGPAIIVNAGNWKLLVQGNHRAFRAMSAEHDEPLCAVEFASPAAFGKMFEVSIPTSGNLGYRIPKIEEYGSRSKPR